MTLEENVLAYLDGSLGEEESAELLHTLSVSPEKRALLDEHLRLTELNALGRKPFAVPAAAERELIARLPFLGGAPKPIPFYAKPMALLASSAAVLAVIGGLWWNASRTEAPQSTAPISHDAPVAVQQSGSNIKDGNDAKDINSNQPIAQFVKHERAVRQSSTSPVEASIVQNEVAAPAESNASNEPVGAISEALLKAADIPTPSVHSPRTLHEIAFGVPDRLHPLSFGLSGMANGYALPTMSGAANLSMGIDPQVNINYDVTQWFAFGVEAGYTQFGKVGANALLDSTFDRTEYSQLTYKTVVTPTGTGYLRAAMYFTVDPTGEHPIRFGAAGGYAFNGTNDPCAAISAGITRTLGDDLSLDLDMVLSGLWSTQVTPSNTPSINGVTGVTHQDANSQAPFTSAFGLRAGIRYRP